MRLGRNALIHALRTNVVEVKFVRRHPKVGYAITRRMLCTNDQQLLESIPGKLALHYKAPKGVPRYYASQHNLVTTWDIFMQHWRNISVESHDVIAMISTRPADNFWTYFNNQLAKMSQQSKIDFMNK